MPPASRVLMDKRSFGRAAVAAACTALAAWLAAGPALAEPPAPRPKPSAEALAAASSKSSVATSAKEVHGNVSDYRESLTAARRGDWSKSRAFAKKSGDPVAVSLASWLYLTDPGTQPDFGELNDFLEAHPDWPMRKLLFGKAEQVMPPNMSNARVLTWYGTREPYTGEGMVRLGAAVIDRGDRAAGEALIRRGWIEGEFVPEREKEIARQYASILTGAPTAARVERLLWQRRNADAARIAGQADPDTQTIVRARLAIVANPTQANVIVSQLPKGLRNEPGLVYERSQAIRRSGDVKGAVPVALSAPSTPISDAAIRRWWLERNALIRDSLQLGLYDEAYRLASAHGLSDGPEFAEAEFLAGWIALRFISRPDEAFAHFKRLFDNVSYPISKARGAYWMARAAEAGGKLDDAARYFSLAANFPTTFYGQLAAVRIHQDRALLALPPEPQASNSRYSVFRTSEVAQAARIAAAANRDDLVRQFLLHLTDLANTQQEYIFAARYALDLGYPDVSVRIAKKASQDDILLPTYAYPVVGVAGVKSDAVEPALMLGLSRQESEFNVNAVSPSGARGLMQLMPATAKLVAKQLKVPFDQSKLTSDPNYNTRLGTAYLGGLINSFGGSYMMAVAGYNAGPNRVKQWMATYGDPRDPKIDTIDWIETIPFSETRNYVQRVLENTQVYRVRLAKTAVPVRLDDDLARPLPAPTPSVHLPAYADTPAGVKAVPVPVPSPRQEADNDVPDAPAPAAIPDEPADNSSSTGGGPRGGPRAALSGGQPETNAVETSCKRLMLGPDGALHCVTGGPNS